MGGSFCVRTSKPCALYSQPPLLFFPRHSFPIPGRRPLIRSHVPRSLYFFFEYDSGADTYDQLARQHSPEVSLDSEQRDGCEYAADPDDQSEGVDEEGVSRFAQAVDDA